MTINNKLNFSFVLADEISHSSAFWFRECLSSRPEVAAELGLVFLIGGLPVDTVVSIQIDASVFFTALDQKVRVSILSFVDDFVI